ncbi:hypothetical protein ACFQ9X_06215 [Catenulispora yoronensis]
MTFCQPMPPMLTTGPVLGVNPVQEMWTTWSVRFCVWETLTVPWSPKVWVAGSHFWGPATVTDEESACATAVVCAPGGSSTRAVMKLTVQASTAAP